MRSVFLTTAAMLALTVTPVLAQTLPAPMARPGNVIGTGDSLPLSNSSSNITSTDTRSGIAPRLPDPSVGPDASPQQLLMAARQSLAANRTGATQEALEQAETRALDTTVAPSRANDPSRKPLVKLISDARDALASGDKAGTMRIIDQALRS